MDKIASYKDMMYKEAGEYREIAKAEQQYKRRLKIKKKAEMEKQAAQKKKEPLISREDLLEYIVPSLGTTIGFNEGARLASKLTNGSVPASLTGAGAGAILGYTVPEKYYRNKRLAKEQISRYEDDIARMKEQLNQQKNASEYKKAEMEKQATLVNRASKVINGVKRGGELLTGSNVKKLNSQLTSLNNSSATNFKESVNNGKKILDTQNKLKSEIGKVKKARTIAGGAVGVPAGIGMTFKNNNNVSE